MKAVILCAGKGERLGELTRDCAKPALLVGDRPLLAHTVQWLRNSGVTEFFVNLHHRPESIVEVFNQHLRRVPPLRALFTHETELLGSAGAIREFGYRLDGEPFFVLNGDNYYGCLSTGELRRVWELFQRGIGRPRACLTTSLVTEVDWSQVGVIAASPAGEVLDFAEKPGPERLEDLRSKGWVYPNAGVYLFAPSVLRQIPETGPADIARDLLPRLIMPREVMVTPLQGRIQDIGTPEGLALARELAQRKVVRV